MPRPPTKPLTQAEKFKQAELQEQELGSLLRQYKILEKDRHLWGLKLARLNRILAIYKREHQNIESDLDVANSSTNKRLDKKDTDHIAKLLEDYEEQSELVKKERTYIKEIEATIQQVKKDVVRLRSMQITDYQHEQRVWLARKTLEGLENKMEVQNQKFGVICAKNRELKQEIDRMLWERDIFMKSWDSMMRKLLMGRKFMMDLIDQATIAYDQREQWVTKLQALRHKAHTDFVMHIEEMRELKRVQDNQKKLEEFYNIKGQRRVMKDLMERERIRRMEVKKKTKERLEQYKQYMKEIWEFTKEKDLNSLAERYYQQEAQNFSIFNRINELIFEVEALNDQLGELHVEIDDERRMDQLRKDRRSYRITELEEELEKVQHDVDDSEKELTDLDHYINDMLTGIGSIFKICKCDKDPILKLLGDNTNINVYNAMFHIELIEKQVHEALVKVYSEEKKEFERKKITGGQRVIHESKVKEGIDQLPKFVQSDPCPLCMEHEMVADVVDSVQHVLTKDEVKKVLKERLQTPELADHLHTVSKCFLPKSREILQKRFA